ncbi:MAG: MBL fold metallo-hydrolase [Rhodospirillales bacterium]|nr:MBL fold metallo-hydrolase [Rhodospirillales bacterium]
MTPKSASSPQITGFFDSATSTVSYLVVDPATKTAAIIDSVLDYDARAGRISTASADKLIAAAAGYKIEWLLETHAHADHLSAAPYLKSKLGGRIAIGALIAGVQKTWKEIFNLEPDFPIDGSQFDHLFDDGERFKIGTFDVTVWNTPGHTPACKTYIVDGGAGPKAAFVGDTLFMPDYGTARADFPGGDARLLFRSIRRILSLPPETRLFMCHDYQPGGRAVAFETTVAEQRKANVHVKDGVTEDDFVAFRTARDKTLGAPALLLPSLQVNIRAGHLPAAENNGTVYFKIPLNRI